MQPIDHLKQVLESVDGLRGKVYLYAYDSPQQLAPPLAVLNYAGTDSTDAINGQIRVAMSIRAQIFVSLGSRADVSRILLDSIKACRADGRVKDISGGTTDAAGPEAKELGALRNMVLAEFLVTVRH